jgi:hypothetical protein
MTKKKVCCGDLPPEARDTLGVLGTCARGQGNELQYCRLIKQTDALELWDMLPRRAEDHGVAPLAYQHLKAIDALIPDHVMRDLKALTVRVRHANRVRAQALAEIAAAMQTENVRPLALKGAALAYMAYPDPALRPMRDMDLLLPRPDLPKAQRILQNLGYAVDPVLERITPGKHHHIPGMVKMVDGLAVSVELHHNLYPPTLYYPSMPYERLAASARPFEVCGQTVYSLGLEDMLGHIYRHAAGPPLLLSDLRFISLADITTLVERYFEQINWPLLRRRYPQVWNILPLLHYLTPWSMPIIERLDLDVFHEPQGVSLPYTGWPRRHAFPHDVRWNRRLLRNTFNPPEWWLRLFYGVNTPLGAAYARYLRHPLHVLEWRLHYLKQDLTHKTPG